MNIFDTRDLGAFLGSVFLFIFGDITLTGTLQNLAFFGSFLVGFVGSVHIGLKMYYLVRDRNKLDKQQQQEEEE